ncbi:MAG: SPOR domain-containing protein [Paracoccus sp. (in: a-proteobacteria)]|uniref:SPOR domain-containing protein n=1 Tax=Paracoccus sp. TaxID=267 RepID=UPI0026E10E3F|nr:SPOR domain-containing protein [Paracoccus sp. (in: a-proteobacteria)]MDO5632951.1 SPOR domain-containing protein [Paracoccus sp. (in: a-proteobacteria)]
MAVCWGGAAWAEPRPAEMPPPDFVSAQYIDSRGCVFQRHDGRWRARLGPDDQPVCGFPPSTVLRRVDSGVLPRMPEPAPISPEQRLMATLAAGLRDGELTDDRALREEIRPAAPTPRPASGPLAELDAMVAAAPALRAGMTAGLRPNDRLCALLGYEGQGRRLPTLGHDVTQGFCAGLTAPELAPMPVANARVAKAQIGMLATKSRQSPAASTDIAPSSTSRRQATAPHRATAAKADAPLAVRRPQPLRPEMVPASARYVLMGRFADQKAADDVIARLTALGYPVSRGKSRVNGTDAVAVLAGPLSDRQSVIAALNDLRGRGYRSAVAQ